MSFRLHALSATTRRAYQSQLSSYLKFCDEMGYKPVPIDKQHLLRYIAHISSRLSANSIPKYLNVVRVIHLECGFPNPTSGWHLQTLIKGIQKDFGTKVNQKLPITPDILLRIRRLIDLEAPFWKCFWAACLVAFYGLLRKSNVFLEPLLPASSQKHLRRKDVRRSPDGSYFIRLQHTKTIQLQQRYLDLPLPLIPGHPLCPVSAILELFASVPVYNPDQPVFVFATVAGPKPLLYRCFLKELKSLLTRLGFPPNKYAGHSFRRGGASWAMEVGLPGEAIQLLGDWQSDVYRRYIDITFSSRVNYVKKLSKSLPNC